MRKWRVGSLSSGLLLILLGVLLLASTFGAIPFLATIIKYWPIILILLGIEVLAFQFLKQEGKLHYDGISMLIVILIVLVSLALIPVHAFQLTDAFAPPKMTSISKQYTLPKGVKKIRIDIPEGDIRLRGSSTNKVHLDGNFSVPTHNKSDQKPLEWFVNGNEATLRVHAQQNGIHSVFADKVTQASVDIPRSIAVDLNAQSGNVEVEGLKASANIQKSAGDLTLNKIQGEVSVNNDYGNIRLKEIKGPIQVENSNGEIRVDNSIGPINLKNLNGDVRINASKIKGNWMASTENGNIDFAFTSDTDATVKGKTSAGELEGTAKWKDDQILLGSGKHQIHLTTANGNIRVDTP